MPPLLELAHVALREDDVQALATIVAGLPGSWPALASGEGDSIAHYTTDAGAIGITEDQEITPGKSGAVYLTPDLYGTAEEAEDKLALDQEPTGYFAIPVDLISDLEGPQPVAEKPLGAGNGGGTEYWTQGTIDATDLEFHPFGE